MNNHFKNVGIIAVVFVLLFVFAQVFQTAQNNQTNQVIPFSDFLKLVDSNQVQEADIAGNEITLRAKSGSVLKTSVPPRTDVVPYLVNKNVVFKAVPPEETHWLIQLLVSWLPFLLFIGLMVFSLKQMQSGGNKAMGFGKSKAKLLNEAKTKVFFKDVAGIDEAKIELEEIVDFLKDPRKFQKLGGKIPRGVLLSGPPGTGKTMLAKAIAGEAGVPFYSISGSDFVEMFVGVGASRVRDMFEQAKKHSPCIVFIDEIDAVGGQRGRGVSGGNEEREQTLNQLLVEMDGFEENESVIIVAATNRPDILDQALLRPGRFDRQVSVSLPDLNGREKIILVHIRKLPIASDVDVRTIARGTPGFSGADLANLINEAALLAARANKKLVSMHEFEMARDKVLMGAERRSLAMTKQEIENTAYHEAGHAIIAHYTPAADPIHKATIIPRGRALGLVMQLPEQDSVSLSREKIHGDIRVCAGGRIAEELIFGHDKVTTGASSDIQHASRLARSAVIQWGLSDKMGFLNYKAEESRFEPKMISEKTAEQVDAEVKKLIDDNYKAAYKLLEKHIDKLHLLAKALLKHETLTGKEIATLLEKGKVSPKNTTKSPKLNSTVPST